jgi:hypothetical protein
VTFTPGYLELCRQNPIQRTLEAGDWLMTCGHGQTIGPNLCHAGGLLPTGPMSKDPLATVYWLPRLDQLLDLLEAAGHRYIGFDWAATTDAWAAMAGVDVDREWYESAIGDSREEAALRLLLKVRA